MLIFLDFTQEERTVRERVLFHRQLSHAGYRQPLSRHTSRIERKGIEISPRMLFWSEYFRQAPDLPQRAHGFRRPVTDQFFHGNAQQLARRGRNRIRVSENRAGDGGAAHTRLFGRILQRFRAGSPQRLLRDRCIRRLSTAFALLLLPKPSRYLCCSHGIFFVSCFALCYSFICVWSVIVYARKVFLSVCLSECA